MAIPTDYRKEEIAKMLAYTQTGKFCQLISIPGGGKASVIRFLAQDKNLRVAHLGEKEKSALFLYINLLEIPNLDEVQIKKFLLLSLDEDAKVDSDPLVLTKQLTKALGDKVSKNITVVFLFDHFDEFQNELPRSFFQMLQSLKETARYKLAIVFATRRDLKELVDEETLRDFYNFFIDNTIYLKIYNQQASEYLFAQIEKVFEKKIPQKVKDDVLAQTAGHAKLTRIITELALKEGASLETDEILKKPIVQAILLEIWLFLTAHEQRVLTSLAKSSHDPVSKNPNDTGSSSPQDKETQDNLIKFDLIKLADPQQFNPLRSRSEASNLTIQQSSLKFTIPIFEKFVHETVPTIAAEKITFDSSSQEIKKGANVISDLLSPQEFRLLAFLVENENKIIQREEIISAVWPEAQLTEGISDEAIDQMVFRLRKKIEDEPNNPKHIQTVKGRGLRFSP